MRELDVTAWFGEVVPAAWRADAAQRKHDVFKLALSYLDFSHRTARSGGYIESTFSIESVEGALRPCCIAAAPPPLAWCDDPGILSVNSS